MIDRNCLERKLSAGKITVLRLCKLNYIILSENKEIVCLMLQEHISSEWLTLNKFGNNANPRLNFMPNLTKRLTKLIREMHKSPM